MPNFEVKYLDDDGKTQQVVVRAAHKYEARDHVKTRGGTAGMEPEEGGEPAGELGVVQLKQVPEGTDVDVDLVGDLQQEADDDGDDTGAEAAGGEGGPEAAQQPQGDGGDGGDGNPPAPDTPPAAA